MRNLVYLVMMLTSAVSFAQVGIETKNPEQTLHVEGKVKIADDDNIPTRGTLRYSQDGDFEGFSGKGWVSLTQQGSASLPGNPVPVYGYDFGVAVGFSNQEVTFERFVDNTSFTAVPNGQFLLVTSIHIEPNGAGQSGIYEVTVGRSNGNFIHQQSALRFNGDRTSQLYQDPLGILLVLRGGESLLVTNENSSDFGVNIKVRGFLVDDLAYE